MWVKGYEQVRGLTRTPHYAPPFTGTGGTGLKKLVKGGVVTPVLVLSKG